MNFDEMRDRITILQNVRKDDGYGGTTTTTVRIATVWANISPVPTSRMLESYALDRIQNTRLHKVVIRYRSDVNESMTIEHNGKTWDILALEDIDGKYLQMVCREVVT